ncbi:MULTISPECIES: STAS domain-containing protein [Streptomyces]|uniref:Anti-sigma factor antagonist n=1 Tax=Streptomyces canarius TaxID=285453 RepID=A0ABQ3CYX7_9ACTN|nr:STAS domain-containing protein [Streptomyces canarius]GHA48017.1 anti-sigma factor antagonist [Streptomyces canarius]
MNSDRPASRDRPHTLRVHVRRLSTGRHLVTVVGDLDLHTASHLADALQPLVLTGGHSVLVDLSDVTFLDSTGLTCLIAVYRTARSTGARLALIAPSERVRRMLALTGTDQVLRSYATPDSVPD